MRLALVIPEYPPFHIGGGGVVFEALAQQFAANHEVRVFSAWDTSRSWRSPRLRSERDGISVYRYPLVPVLRTRPYLRSVVPPNPIAARNFVSDLEHWSPQVAHLHGYGYALVDLAAWLFSRLRIPYILTVHGLPQTPLGRHWPVRLAYRLYQRLGANRTCDHAAAVTAVSRSVADELPQRLSVQVVPNGVSALPASDSARASRLRAELGIASGIPVIAGAGRLSASKGFDLLIRSLPLVEVPAVACVIAGTDGGELKNLTKLAADLPAHVKVFFPGWYDRQRLADLFELSTVVAVPSRNEPFGLIAFEALGAHVRVVAASDGGFGEFLTGLAVDLLDSDDAHVWAEALTSALLRGCMSELEISESERLLAGLSWQLVAGQYEALMVNAAKAARQH